MKMEIWCYCCEAVFDIDVLDDHHVILDDLEECPDCTHDYNVCEYCNKGLDSFYENYENWGVKGEKPIWTENYHEVVYAECLGHRWDSNITCPRCGYVNVWDDSDI